MSSITLQGEKINKSIVFRNILYVRRKSMGMFEQKVCGKHDVSLGEASVR